MFKCRVVEGYIVYMSRETVLVGLQWMIGQSSNSVIGYIGCVLIGLYKVYLVFYQSEYSEFYFGYIYGWSQTECILVYPGLRKHF